MSWGTHMTRQPVPPAPARPLPGRKRTRARLRAPAFSARCSPQTRAYGPRRHMPRRPIGWGTQQAQETGAHALQPPAGEPGRGCARLAGAQQAHCRQQGHATAAPMAPKRDRRPALTEGYPAVQLARLQRRYSACLAPRRRSSSDHRCFRKSRSAKNPRERFREICNKALVQLDLFLLIHERRELAKGTNGRMLGSIAATVARALPEEAGRVRPCCLSCAVADPRAQELAPTKVGFRLRRARRGSGTRVHGSSWIPDVDRPQAHRGGQRHCSQRLH